MAARDWRNPADYAWLADLDLSGLAWEFLRRDPAYAEAQAAGQDVTPFGLEAPLDPELSAAEAPLFWRAEIAPAHVVRLEASEAGAVSAATLGELSLFGQAAPGVIHLRLPGGLQLVLPAGDAASLAAHTPLDAHLGARLSALRALERLLAGRAPGGDPLSRQGRRRAVAMTRALDGRAAGAAYREIGEVLLGAGEEGRAWRTAPARDVAIRLCRAALRMMGGGYFKFLNRAR